jgi:hypothetical protein
MAPDACNGLSKEQVDQFYRDGCKPLLFPAKNMLGIPTLDFVPSCKWLLAKNMTFAGFLVIKDFATQDEVRALRERAGILLEGFDPPSTSKSVFSTKSQVHDTLLPTS